MDDQRQVGPAPGAGVPGGSPPATPREVAIPAAPDTRLIISLGLNLVITILQVAGGILANSLGLLSDAAHNLSDVVALGLSLWAVRLGRRPATPRRTFAYKRAEILVAMFNSAVLVAISVYIIVEAVGRIRSPQPVEGLLVVIFAGQARHPVSPFCSAPRQRYLGAAPSYTSWATPSRQVSC
jgi:hypothetical protein